MELWIPTAIRLDGKKMVTHGKYPKGYPEGLVIHTTAGHDNPVSTLDYGISQGHCYLLIDGSGKLYQHSPLNEWGMHSGATTHPVISNPVHKRLAGVENCNAGILTPVADNKYKSWFGKVYDSEDVRIVPQYGIQKAGAYHKMTESQELTLIELILWLKVNNPDVFNLDWVLGHDEVAPNRKSDPGGSLSMDMATFRGYIKKLWDERVKA